MPLDPDLVTAFNGIGQLFAAEISAKLSSLINKRVSLSYIKLSDSIMSGDIIKVSDDAAMLDMQITEPEGHNKVYLVISMKLASTVADFLMAGDGSNATNELDPAGEAIFTEAVKQVKASLFERLKLFHESFVGNVGEPGMRKLLRKSISSLEKPSDLPEEQFSMSFELSITDKHKGIIQVEIPSEAAHHLYESLKDAAINIDFNDLTNKFLIEYTGEDLSSSDQVEGANEGDEEEFDDASAMQVNEKRNLGIIRDIDLELIVELGRAELLMHDVLKLTRGSAIELDKTSKEPVDLFINNQLVAKGEVVAIDDNFGLKINKVVGPVNLAKVI